MLSDNKTDKQSANDKDMEMLILDSNVLNLKEITEKLDKSLPLDTDSWRRVEQLLNYLTEFAPTYKVIELADAIGKFADHQAKMGYLIGQKDLVSEISNKLS